MSSRLERHIADVVTEYDQLPAGFRERFEAALVAATATLEVAEEIKVLAPTLGRKFLEVAMMVFSDGKLAGNWTKVHKAIAAAAPRVYPHVRRILPVDDGASDLGL